MLAVTVRRLWLIAAATSLLTAAAFAQTPAAPAGATPPAGFVALFNGHDLTGWQGLVGDPLKRAKMSAADLAKAQQEADARMREHWKVEDGVLAFDGKGDNLCTIQPYGDFELLVDWKIPAGGDSGIYLRGSPQVQIWDKPAGSGGLYNNKHHAAQPLIAADHPVGEWNTFRILMSGERVTVYLNDLLVVDDTPLENYWDPNVPIFATGPIELQNHGGPLWFRNVFVRPLPAPAVAAAPEPVLKKGDRVAVIGDSITEQKIYSRFIEDYLLACVPQLDLNMVQLGWSGEHAPGFVARIENDLFPLKPTVATTCYGMNDGRYKPYEPAIGQTYREAMQAALTKLRAANIRVVVGSPGAVDTATFKGIAPNVYNDNLAHLRDIARELARDNGQPFADVHDHMILAMRKAKPVLGDAYHVCGGDGFHPSPNGHIVMAYAFLKGLGLDGQIGTITCPWGKAATATDGHKVLNAKDGTIEVESTRWPFCFFGDAAKPDGSKSIVPYVPFNADLNRLMLVVTDLPTAKAQVSWGGEPKEFTREQLAAGINLAHEFLDNPFSEAFGKLDAAVAEKQKYETQMIKDFITRHRTLREWFPNDAALNSALDAVRDKLLARETELQAKVRGLVQPVKHTVVVKPVGE
jgi:lysophospholipase L1-like esterase